MRSFTLKRNSRYQIRQNISGVDNHERGMAFILYLLVLLWHIYLLN